MNNNRGITVLVWGTFDLLHKAHKEFLQKARKLGDKLHVIIVPDKIVLENKKRKPIYSEKERKEMVTTLSYVTSSSIDSLDAGLQTIKELKVEVICLGHDQNLSYGEKGQNPMLVRLPIPKNRTHTTSLIKKLRGVAKES